MADDTSPTPAGAPTVAVCVATLRRPNSLRRLIDGLGTQVFTTHAPRIRLVVIENEEEGPAKGVCEAGSEAVSWPVEWHAEPRRGISHARNRAVACVGDSSEFVAFIDDDEVPEPDWLDQLLRVQQAYDADVVTGPVIRRFEEPAPSWLERSRLYESARYPTGTTLNVAKTGNALVRTAALHAVDGPFDERFALLGGEDSHCFRRLSAAGFRIVWADEAIVYEDVPGSRARVVWLMGHAYRLGVSWAIREYDLNPTISMRLRTAGHIVQRVARGLVLLPLSLAWGRAGLVRALHNFCLASGLATGMIGKRHEPYSTVHGS
jgi:GT2 family glycosyltransferase